MTVLVTGGAGYIGSHAVKRLREDGREVVVLDNLYNGFRKSLLGAQLEVGDIRDEALVRDICRKYRVDAVMHFAALKSVGDSMDQPHRYFEWNVFGSIQLTRAVMESGISKLVFSSSASVYGSGGRDPFTEQLPFKPESVYAATKASVENYLEWCSNIGLRSVSLRYFNAAGASSNCSIGEDWIATQNLIPRMMNSMITQKQILKIFGTDYPTPDGTCIRDYIHVEDLAAAHVLALDYLDNGGKSLAVNVGSGRGFSVREVIDTAERVSGRSVPVEVAPRRRGDPAVILADCTLAKAKLGWRPTLDLTRIIQSSYEWHIKYPMGYQ